MIDPNTIVELLDIQKVTKALLFRYTDHFNASGGCSCGPDWEQCIRCQPMAALEAAYLACQRQVEGVVEAIQKEKQR